MVQNDSVLRQTFLLAGGLLAVLAAPAQTHSAAEIIRLAFERDEKNDVIARQYTFQQRMEKRNLRQAGRDQVLQVMDHDVTLLDGSEYERLIAKNDRPLSPKEEHCRKLGRKSSASSQRQEHP